MSVGVCAQREDKCSAPPASRPSSPTTEPALIVLNVDYSRATAPWGQILAKMIDRPRRGEQMMFESTAAPGERQSGAERREHASLFLFVSAGSCSRGCCKRPSLGQPWKLRLRYCPLAGWAAMSEALAPGQALWGLWGVEVGQKKSDVISVLTPQSGRRQSRERQDDAAGLKLKWREPRGD